MSHDAAQAEPQIAQQQPGRIGAQMIGVAAVALCAIGLSPWAHRLQSERPGDARDLLMAAALLCLGSIVLACSRVSPRRLLACALWEAAMFVTVWWAIVASMLATITAGDDVPGTLWCLAASALLRLYVFAWAWRMLSKASNGVPGSRQVL